MSTREVRGNHQKEAQQGTHLTLEIKGLVGTSANHHLSHTQAGLHFLSGDFLPAIKGSKEFPLAEEACEEFPIDCLPQLTASCSVFHHFRRKKGRQGERKKSYPCPSLFKTLDFQSKTALFLLKATAFNKSNIFNATFPPRLHKMFLVAHSNIYFIFLNKILIWLLFWFNSIQ